MFFRGSAPPSPDYVPGPEEPEQAPPSPDYVLGPEHTDDEIVAEDQPYAEDASPTAQSPDYVSESNPEAEPEEDDDKDLEEDHVDYPADGGDDGDDDRGSSEDDKDDDIDIEANDDEEHLAPVDSVVVALPTTDQAPFAEETESFETDESAATPPPHPAYRVTTRISIPAPVPTPVWSDAEVARLLAISTPPSSPLSPWSSPLPQIPSPSLPLSPPSPVLSPAPPPSPIRSLGYQAVMIRMRAEAASTSHSLPLPPPFILSPTRPDAPSLRYHPATLTHILPTSHHHCYLPSASHREDNLSSSAAAARPAGGLRAYYGFVATIEIKRSVSDPEREETGCDFKNAEADQRRSAERESRGQQIIPKAAAYTDIDSEACHTGIVTTLQDSGNTIGQMYRTAGTQETRWRKWHQNEPKVNTGHNNPAPTTTTTTSVTNAQLQAMIDQGVTAALAARDANRNDDNSHTSGTGGKRTERVVRECTYQDFMKCKPLYFKGTEGVVELTQWFERMETVFRISNCSMENQIKFSTCTLLAGALTRSNSHVLTVSHDVAYAMTWADLRKKMTDKYCLRNEMKKLEAELWNLKVKGTDVIGYNQRFQELALLCVRMFPEEFDKIERYVGGLPDMIHGNIVALNPKTMQEAVEMATELMDKKVITIAERQAENKRKAYTAGTGEKKLYGGSKPLCAKCNYHHDGSCAPKCHKCNKVGHFAHDCRSVRNANNANNQRGTGNHVGNDKAPAKVYVVAHAGTNPDSNIVTGTFLLNNRYASILFDTGADRSFVSTAFSSQMDIMPSTLDHYYDVELADGRIIGLNTILRGCTLSHEPPFQHKFNARRTWLFRCYSWYGLVGKVSSNHRVCREDHSYPLGK
ncbi:putative reverse transcriptase domain-containing protein [Tanacetum coccineum]